MFDQPLLRDHILDRLIYFNSIYLFSLPWPLWLAVVGIILGLAVFLLRKALRSAEFYGAADYVAYKFNRYGKADIAALGALILVLGGIGWRMFAGENTLFENFDLMAINTTKTMKFGLTAMFNDFRIAPLSFWSLSTLYAITENILLIKVYVFLQILLLTWLLYILLSFIPVARRLLLLAVFMQTPAFVETCNIIFVERSLLITLTLSLLCLRKYRQTLKSGWCVGFLFFANFAIYTKETAVLFYAGLTGASILYNVWAEKITLTSFVHPLRTIKQLPVEFLTGLSMLLYAVIYFIMMRPETSYISYNQLEIAELLNYYKFELVLNAAALICLVISVYKNRKSTTNPLFSAGGILCGGLAAAAGMVFVLRLAPSSPHLAGKTYYLLLSELCALIYLFDFIRGNLLTGLLITAILGYSTVVNVNDWQNEPGKYYREVANVIGFRLQRNQPNSIFVVETGKLNRRMLAWVIETYLSAYRYYFNGYNITFKTPHFIDVLTKGHIKSNGGFRYLFFPGIRVEKPSSGDWVIVSKSASTENRPENLPEPLFSNKLFEVYHMQ